MSRFGSIFAYLKASYQFLHLITALVVIGVPIFYWRYKAAIQRRKEKIKAKLARGLVYRDKVSRPDRVVKALELHPSFKHAHSHWPMMSLGEYLSTLRFFTDTEDDDEEGPKRVKMLEKELYVVIASMLMKALGDTVGSAFLPVLGMKPAETMFETISSKIVSYMVAKFFVNASSEKDWDPTHDLAALPLNVSELMSFVNLNQKLNDGNMDLSPIHWMNTGEICYDPTYHTPEDSSEEILVPNPFVIEEHYEIAILGMEDRIIESQRKDGGKVTYDPNSKSNPEPTPINKTILPDLHLGWGDAKKTHTEREILRGRLFAVLLTKLSYNYDLLSKGQLDECFVVQMNGIDCILPDEFLKVLCDSGHTIEVCPRSTITTFGMAACVKEADGSWTNIPVAFFFRTGYESHRQRPAYYHALHGGIDMKIEGPLVGIDRNTGLPNKCDIQYYMAIEGMCGWHSNWNADVPWIDPVSTCKIYSQEEALAAVRMAGMLACTFNQIGTEMDLPFGGYGVLGVCNDTAAIVDYAVRGETNMYPLLSTGRFLMHTAKFLAGVHDALIRYSKGEDGKPTKRMKASISDSLRLASAACNMKTDIHCSPKQMIGAARRYSSNYPTCYFQISEDSKEVMQEIRMQYLDLESKLKENKKKKTPSKLLSQIAKGSPKWISRKGGFSDRSSRRDQPPVQNVETTSLESQSVLSLGLKTM